MSLESKWIVTGLVLAFLIPFTTTIVLRIVRRQPFRKTGGIVMPPLPPSV